MNISSSARNRARVNRLIETVRVLSRTASDNKCQNPLAAQSNTGNSLAVP
jgi:hypothetical protein